MKIIHSIILFGCLLQIVTVTTYAMDLDAAINMDLFNRKKIAALEERNKQLKAKIEQRKHAQKFEAQTAQSSSSITTASISRDIVIGISGGIVCVALKNIIAPLFQKK